MGSITHIPPSLPYIIEEIELLEGLKVTAPKPFKPIYQECIDALRRIKSKIAPAYDDVHTYIGGGEHNPPKCRICNSEYVIFEGCTNKACKQHKHIRTP